MRSLYRLLRLWFCPHFWDVMEKRNVDVVDYDGTHIYTYTKYTSRCRRCGELKFRKDG